MYKFQEWVAIRETVEGEIMRLKFIYPKARASKIASIMREKGYNLGATEVRHVIKKWETQSPEVNALRHSVADEKLNKQVAFFLTKNPNLTPEQIMTLLQNNGIFAEPWQVAMLVRKYKKPISEPRQAAPKQLYTPEPWQIDKRFVRPKKDEEEKDYEPPDNVNFFGQGTGGGERIRRSTRYN